MDVREEIARYIPVDRFVEIQTRVLQLRKEEERQLQALSDLQKMYLAANSDFERESVRAMVGKIREISKRNREEIRTLNQEISKCMTLQQAKELYERLAGASEVPSESI